MVCSDTLSSELFQTKGKMFDLQKNAHKQQKRGCVRLLLRVEATSPNRWAHSSAVEHYLDMVGVTGSIPVAPTICSVRNHMISTTSKAKKYYIALAAVH
jgi:hypothetical protein